MLLTQEDLTKQAEANREAALHRLEGVGSDMSTMMYAMNCTLQTVRNLSGSGVLVKTSMGKWNLVESLHRFHLWQDQQTNKVPSSTERFRQARASHIELKNAVLVRSVVPIAEVEKLWSMNASVFREVMVSYPGAAKRELGLSFEEEQKLELLMDAKMIELQELLEPEAGVPGKSVKVGQKIDQEGEIKGEESVPGVDSGDGQEVCVASNVRATQPILSEVEEEVDEGEDDDGEGGVGESDDIIPPEIIPDPQPKSIHLANKEQSKASLHNRRWGDLVSRINRS